MTAVDAKVRATASVGYKAVVDHFIEHGLPAPESIELTGDGMRVWVIFGRQQWVDSIHVDHTEATTLRGTDRERVRVTGHLPGLLGLIKVELRYSRPVRVNLQVVGS